MAKHAERIIATQDPSMDVRKAMGWQVDEVGMPNPDQAIHTFVGARVAAVQYMHCTDCYLPLLLRMC